MHKFAVVFMKQNSDDMFYLYDIDNNDSDDPKAILSGNVGEIAKALAYGNKYIYSKDMSSSTLNP